MRVAIINPWEENVTIKEMERGLQAIYDNLSVPGQKPVDDFNVVQLARTVTLYVDGAGFLKPDQPVWYIKGYTRDGRSLPLCGKGILFGSTDAVGNDLPLPAYISELTCFDAVTWSTKFSTGALEPTVEKPGLIIIGQPILREQTHV